jgi:LPXTG-motif cell wall-anchored protein
MKMLRGVFGVMALGLFVAVLITPAQIRRDQKTKVTFNRPMEIPGQVLPAGTYYFKLFDSMANRNIVEVWNEDETQRLALILAIGNLRFTPTDNPVIEYKEQYGDQPHALRAWFYGGQKEGLEFVYPKSRAVEIAQASQETVPAETFEPTETNMRTVPLIAITPRGTEEPVAKAFEAAEPATVAEELPKTASSTPLIALLGAAFIGIGLGLKRLVKQHS